MQPPRLSQWPFYGEALRSVLGVSTVVVIAAWWGPAGAALPAGMAAAIAGAVSLDDAPHGRIPPAAWASAQMAVAVFLGVLTFAHPALFIGTVLVWCFAAGLTWAVTPAAGLVSAASATVLIASPAQQASVGQAAVIAGLTVAGGLWQVLVIAIWPRPRWAAQRVALTNAYRAVSRYARAAAADPAATLDRTSIDFLRAAFTLTERQAKARPLAYSAYYGLPERFADTIAALGAAAGPALLRATADVIDALTATARRDPAAVEHALSAFDAAARSGADGDRSVRRLVDNVRALEMIRLHDLHPELEPEMLRRPGFLGSQRHALAVMRSHLRFSSPVFRHAIRLSIGVGGSVAAVVIWHVSHGFWLPLTVLMVTRPDRTHTRERVGMRIAGNVLGVTAASAVAVLVHPVGALSAVAAVVCLGIAYAVVPMGYVALSAALAAGTVFLIDVTGTADMATLLQRIALTVAGGLVAVLTHVCIPAAHTEAQKSP